MTLAQNLKTLANTHYGFLFNRKPDHYLEVYASYLEPLMSRPLEILELGVFGGESLVIWHEAMPAARIVGLDIRESPPLIASLVESGAVHFVRGDQSNPDDLQRCLDLTTDGRFDVIIDDASHVGALSRASFDFLFMNGLKDKGLYFVEDFGAAYGPLLDGHSYVAPPPLDLSAKVFPSHDVGLAGWLKQLLDEVTVQHYFNAEHTARPLAACHFWPNLALIEKL